MKVLTVSALLLGLSIPAASAQTPLGEWLVADGSARIKIAPCKSALWGTISWTKEPGVDANNPDRSKRTRDIVGVPILLGMVPAKSNRWEGKVYNAEDGSLYDASITLTKPDVLRIEGCGLMGLICDGENWTRTEPPAAAAGKKPAAKPAAPVADECPAEAEKAAAGAR